MMTFTVIHAVMLMALAAVGSPTSKNPVFKELTEQGITMSDDSVVKLPPPILRDGLDAAAQRAALEKLPGPVDELLKKSYYSPVVVKVRTPKPPEGESPAVRFLDLWFVAHGDWNTLTSKEFLESATKTGDEGKSRVVSKSGELTGEEMAARKLSATTKESVEERSVYSTFSLFERVEISATRHAVLTRGPDSIVVAGKVDPRFDKDPDYPNQWRPLLRDEQAEIKPGPAHPLAHAGGYAKITRLTEPADAVFIEFHLVYEEPYGWFDGVNLVKQKTPMMVLEKVRAFRRKLAVVGKPEHR